MVIQLRSHRVWWIDRACTPHSSKWQVTLRQSVGLDSVSFVGGSILPNASISWKCSPTYSWIFPSYCLNGMTVFNLLFNISFNVFVFRLYDVWRCVWICFFSKKSRLCQRIGFVCFAQTNSKCLNFLKKKVLIFFWYVIVSGLGHFFLGLRKKIIKFCDDIQFLTLLSDWHSGHSYWSFMLSFIDVINIELETVDDRKKKCN